MVSNEIYIFYLGQVYIVIHTPLVRVALLSQHNILNIINLYGLEKQRESFCENLERAKGFEPSTSTLARLRSTPELRPHNLYNYHFEFISQYLRKRFI